MNYAGILKRGYLFDKKVGILPVTVDRKRWYVLKQDVTQGNQVIMQFYKDEKAAYKGDRPKGSINIHDVVSVRRVVDKKQSFEILCPGVGYRLMANSELEADEWTQAIRNHISYTRDDGSINTGMKSLSLNRMQNNSPRQAQQLTGTSPHHHHKERQRALSDSHHPSQHIQQAPPFHQHQHHLLQPRSIPIVPPRTHRSTETHNTTVVQMNQRLSTPPESLSSPPSLPSFLMPPPSFQRQRSVDTNVSLHSTSSDSSSMCSGSNTSFEGGGGGGAVFEADGLESKSLFRVQVKETENLSVSGPADLVVNEEGLRLQSLSPDQRELMYWPLGSLRRYGVNNHCFTIITGRFCATGEGRFQFYTDESRIIHAKLHGYATQKAIISGRSRSMPRRASEPIEFGGRSPQQTTPIHSINPTQSLPPHLYSTSPPIMYSHSPVRGIGGGVQYTHSITQPISAGSHNNMLPNQHFMPHFSPTKSMHYPQHISANQSQNTFPNAHFYAGSPPDSLPILPLRSREFQNQSLPDKSVSSESSSGGDSGCPIGSGGETASSSEVPSPVSDQEVILSDIIVTTST